MAQTYIEKQRQKLLDAAAAASSQRDGNIFTPSVGSVKLRIVLPKNPEDYFYHTHSYHFLENIGPNGKGKYIYSKKNYEVDGKKHKCPIDVAASEFYKTEDEKFTKIAGKIKRKRHYYMKAILVDEVDPDKKLVILKDTSNDAKLLSKLCSIMGIPFMRDIEDNWWEKSSQDIDPDKERFDLLDPVDGFDVKIIKKKVGKDNWDISYDESYAVRPARPLSKEELKLIKDDENTDIRTLITYEDDYESVKADLAEYLKTLNLQDNAKSDKPSSAKKANNKKAVDSDSLEDESESEDESVDNESLSEEDILAALD